MALQKVAGLLASLQFLDVSLAQVFDLIRKAASLRLRARIGLQRLEGHERGADLVAGGAVKSNLLALNEQLVAAVGGLPTDLLVFGHDEHLIGEGWRLLEPLEVTNELNDRVRCPCIPFEVSD